MAVRVLREDAFENEGERAGFAGAGGAEHREMLAQHVVHRDAGEHGVVLVDRADGDGAAVIERIDDRGIVFGGGVNDGVERGELRDAAAEQALAGNLVVSQFAEQSDFGDFEFSPVDRLQRHRIAETFDNAIHGGVRAADADEVAHFYADHAGQVAIEQHDDL
jgi:hypothetical protein